MKYEFKVNPFNSEVSEVVGMVNGREVIVVSNHSHGIWGVGSSQCLPFNLEEAATIAEWRQCCIQEGRGTEMSKVLDLGEAQIRSMIEQLGPKDFITCLHNACCHGKVFVDSGFEGAMIRDQDDSILKEWFKHLDKLSILAKRIETE